MSVFFSETFHHPLRGGTLKRLERSAAGEWRPEQFRDLGCPPTWAFPVVPATSEPEGEK